MESTGGYLWAAVWVRRAREDNREADKILKNGLNKRLNVCVGASHIKAGGV